jgi:hypothetical protein
MRQVLVVSRIGGDDHGYWCSHGPVGDGLTSPTAATGRRRLRLPPEAVRRYFASASLAHLHADHFAADDDLYAPVELTACGGAVVRDRVGFTQPLGCDAVG